MYARRHHQVGLSGLGYGEEQPWYASIGQGFSNLLGTGAVVYLDTVQQKNRIKMMEAQNKAQMGQVQQLSLLARMKEAEFSSYIMPVALGVGAIGIYWYMSKR